MKVVVGGIVEKDGKVLLVQELKERCYGKWNIPAGGLEINESLVEGAIREIKEETGCDVEITGLLSLVNDVAEDRIFIAVVFATKLINEKIQYNKNEILDVKWFDIDDVINNMDEKLRNVHFVKHGLQNLKEGKIASLDFIKDIRNENK